MVSDDKPIAKEASSDAPAESCRGSLRRHPIFPIFLLILACMVTGEFYPFSPFSMYSNPSPVPLRFCYVTDGDGEALPILWHTGVSPASLTKKYRTHRGDIQEAIASGQRGSMDDMAIRKEAGETVLKWLRGLSYDRSNRELTGPIELVEVAISAGREGLNEDPQVVAELGKDPVFEPGKEKAP